MVKSLIVSEESVCLKRRIERVHLEFPAMSPSQIAGLLGCSPSSVRHVRANGLAIPYGNDGRPCNRFARRRWNLASGLLSSGA